MLEEALSFWNAIKGKVREAIREDTRNAVRMERYDVTTAPNGTKIGVSQPFGDEIFVPYSAEVANAQVGDTVLLVWWNSLSTAKAYYFGDGYNGLNVSNLVTSVNGKTGAVNTRKFDFTFAGTSAITTQVDTAISENGIGSYSFSIPSGENNDMPSATGAYYGFIQCTSTNYIQITCYGNTGSINGVRIWRRIKTNGSWDGWRPVPSTGFIPANSSFNDYIEPGMYRFQTGMTPTTGIDYGQLLVVRGTSDTCAQMVFPYVDSAIWSAKMRWGYEVTGSSPTWGAWRTIRDSVNTPTPTRIAPASTTLSVASGTTTTLTSVSLTPGIYIVSFGANFANNSTGYRAVCMSTTTSFNGAPYPGATRVPAASGTPTWISCTTSFNITATTTIYFLLLHNAGSAINVSGSYSYVKLA